VSFPIRFFILAVFATSVLVGTYACNSSPKNNAETQSKAETQPAPETQATAEKPSTRTTPIVLTELEQQTIKEFEQRAKEYADLHQKLEGTIPGLSDKSTPEEIEAHRRSMTAMIQKERVNAKPGEFFTPATVALVKRILDASLDGTSGEKTEEAVMDENPGTLPDVGVNDRYPDGVPVTSMPNDLLEQFPQLPEMMEYRFLGKRLILLDSGTAVVLDVTPNVMP
jgi:hypothetical protein